MMRTTEETTKNLSKEQVGAWLIYAAWLSLRLILTAWITWTSLLIFVHFAELERGYSGAVGGEALLVAVVGVLCWKLLGARRR